jgi:L-threonylcarbamoyladenylate synthase
MNPNKGPSAAPMRILPVDPSDIGTIRPRRPDRPWIDDWDLELNDSASARNIAEAAARLRSGDLPVAFPTETVYGLGADATRGAAVRAVFAAKGRPADNPLIVHFASVEQLRRLLRPGSTSDGGGGEERDPIPPIYAPLLRAFWPGPLTILLPLPEPSPLAREVSAGQRTFAARVPRSPTALALLRLAGAPLAAPSANASGRPSPTAAAHVAADLEGRGVACVLDAGACDVGVESTVVDGLVDPPVVLRPGGVGVAQLRRCPGWENVRVAGHEGPADDSAEAPRAPGMKYRHYAPRARVVLFEPGAAPPGPEDLRRWTGSVGFVRTGSWARLPLFAGEANGDDANGAAHANGVGAPAPASETATSAARFMLAHAAPEAPRPHPVKLALPEHPAATAYAVDLGGSAAEVGRGLFAALRGLDALGVQAILVEGVGEDEGDVAGAVMNRLRKAAEERVG